MSEIVLHHYDASPFSEKIRLILGRKGLAWRSALAASSPSSWSRRSGLSSASVSCERKVWAKISLPHPACTEEHTEQVAIRLGAEAVETHLVLADVAELPWCQRYTFARGSDARLRPWGREPVEPWT